MEQPSASPGPRTAEEPMAFTRGELARGVMAACVAFGLATPVVAIIVLLAFDSTYATFSLYLVATGWLIGIVPTTTLAGFAFAPLARLVGRRLTREKRRWPHVLSHAALGAAAAVVMGALVGLLIGATSWRGDALQGATLGFSAGALACPLAAAAAAYGWWFTARRAFADDRAAAE